MVIWEKPYYKLKTPKDEEIIIDVTKSVNTALRPNKAINEIIKLFKYLNVETVVDFGAGALRHSIPLLNKGFEVCGVEFKEQFSEDNSKKECVRKRHHAESFPNFSKLIYPDNFINDKRIFNSALLCYTFQGMPIIKEREYVIELLSKKITSPGFLVWMSRWGDSKHISNSQAVANGHYKYARSKHHSFYKEYRTEEIKHLLTQTVPAAGFYHIKSLGEGGRDQIYIYGRGEINNKKIQWPPIDVRKTWI